jgi:hypothetical protein
MSRALCGPSWPKSRAPAYVAETECLQRRREWRGGRRTAIEHAHVHIIPRRNGDVPDPRGGIRRIIDDKANYWDR